MADSKSAPTRPHAPFGTRQPKWAAAIRAAFASYADAATGGSSVVLLDDLVSVVVAYCEWPQRVLTAGACDGPDPPFGVANSLHVYDSVTNGWMPILTHSPPPLFDSLNISYSGVNLTVCGEYLYAIGGSDPTSQQTPRRTVQRLRLGGAADGVDSARPEWSECAVMNSARTAGYAYACDDRIFMIGGYMNAAPMMTVVPGIEVYHPTDDAWDVLPCEYNLNLARSQMSVVRCRDRLYVLGGSEAVAYSVESISYDALLAASERVRAMRTGDKSAVGTSALAPEAGWELEPEMKHGKRIGAVSFVYRDTIFSVAGTSDSITVERYCPRGEALLLPLWLTSGHVAAPPTLVANVTHFNEHFILITFHGATKVVVADMRTAPEWTLVTGIPPLPVARRWAQTTILPF